VGKRRAFVEIKHGKEVEIVPTRKSVTRPVVKAGKRVMATDTAQGVVGAVVDKMEEIAVDKADDVAANVKERAAKAGGRKPPRSTKSTAKRSTPKKSSAKRSTPKKSSAKRSTAKKSSAKRSTPKKSSAKRSTAKSRSR
jgi:hypothetical protein